MTDDEEAQIEIARDMLSKNIETGWMYYAADALQILEQMLRDKPLAAPPETA